MTHKLILICRNLNNNINHTGVSYKILLLISLLNIVFGTSLVLAGPHPEPQDLCLADASQSVLCQETSKSQTYNPVVGENSLTNKIINFIITTTGAVSVTDTVVGSCVVSVAVVSATGVTTALGSTI